MVKSEIKDMRRLLIPVSIACAVLAGAAGCTSDDAHLYLGHSDKVTSDAGDANATNDVAHTVDPWSRASRNTHIEQNGNRARVAADRHAADAVKQPSGLNDGGGAQPPGGGAPAVAK